jgi:Arc/MetJ-type ribon-helix-helix transcriptional regulator
MANPLSRQVALSLIKAKNGGTAQEIIKGGINTGIIKGTLPGQVGALVKLYNGGKIPEVKRDEQNRPYRYYINGPVNVQQLQPFISGAVTFRTTQEQEDILTALIETKRFSNKSEAVQWLISEGIASKRGDINKIVQTYKEIESLQLQVKKMGI